MLKILKQPEFLGNESDMVTPYKQKLDKIRDVVNFWQSEIDNVKDNKYVKYDTITAQIEINKIKAILEEKE